MHKLEASVITKRLIDIYGTVNPEIGENVWVPPLRPLRSIIRFFSMMDIWTEVGGQSYIPRYVLSELIERIDGEEKDQNQFSVFMSDRRDMLRERLGIEPLTVTPKQKFQFYEKPYATAILSSIINFKNTIYHSSNEKAPHKILPAYQVVDDISPEKLYASYNDFYLALDNVRFYK